MNQPLVSVIVPTKNSSQFFDECLLSIRNQTYSNIELIVVDNFSSDDTVNIAKKFTNLFFQTGPERCTQRNFGALKATGKYVIFIDSDMVLSSPVIQNCVKTMEGKDFKGVIIPEESFGVGFWAQCKKLERSFYIGVDSIEAARFFYLSDFNSVGGYNELLISGEDWDLSDRIELLGKYTRIDDFIYHNEGKISLYKTLQKKYYYAKKAGAYLAQTRNISTAMKRKQGVVGRYLLFFKQPLKLFRTPTVGLGMLFMKTCEFGFGGVGLTISKFK